MSVGTRLKKARKSLGLSIEDIQDKSKIKKNYLKAIENDNFDKLPGEVYTKVYIRGYAKIVGLDPQEILAEYTNENGKNSNKEIEKKDKKVKKDKKKKEELTKADKVLKSIIGIILILILVLLSYNLFFRSDQNQNGTAISNQNTEVVEQESTNNNINSNNNEEENNQNELEETESVDVVVNGSANDSNIDNNNNENISEENQPEPEEEKNNNETQLIVEDNTKEFKIIATDKSWLQVTIDDDLKFQGFINEDETMTHNGEETVTLKIGNGVAVQVEINGEVLGPFGKRGEVIIKQFDLK